MSINPKTFGYQMNVNYLEFNEMSRTVVLAI